MWKPSVTPSEVLRHSQGPWEDHKYVKIVDGKYYYPNGYDEGRTVSDLKSDDKSSEDSGKAVRSEYSKDDSDFDDKNYSDDNLLGDTNFYGFKGKDGRTVIVEEDKKWTLPKGTKLDSALIKRLEAVDKEIEERRDKGEKISSDEWNKLVEDAINGTKSDSKKKSVSKSSGKKSSKGSKSSSKAADDKARKAKNKATMKARTEEQQKNKQKRMIKNKLAGKEYLNHSFWAPTDDFLMHHGVDGQKWGVKNGPPYPLDRGHKTSGKRKYRTDKGYNPKNQNGSKKRKASQMSNEDLKRQINRKELEQRYNDLSDAQISRGRQKVMSLVRDYASIAGAVATTAAIVKTAYQIKNGKFGK